MGKKHRNLYPQIYDWDNLLFAYREAKRGKSRSSSFLCFKEYYLKNLRDLQKSLKEKSWFPDDPIHFEVSDPKKRTISCQSFRDRVVHHALMQVVGPILDDAMMPQVYACRRGKGTHRCVKRLQQLLRKNPDSWILHVDFRQFFPTIPQDLLLTHLSKKLSCGDTIDLLGKVLSIQGEGLPIGALTSQILSNYWGGKLDRFISNNFTGKFVRYMDDTAILVKDRKEGKEIEKKIEEFVKEHMSQSIGKWGIYPPQQGVTFCGFRIRKKFKLIKKQSVIRQNKRLRALLKKEDYDGWKRSQIAWLGHLRHADGQNALVKMEMGCKFP